MGRQIRTYRLNNLLGGANLRLSGDDRTFLKNLAKLRIIGQDSVEEHHYQNRRSSPLKRLEKLEQAGLIRHRHIVDPTHGRLKVYEFADERVAKAFGSRMPGISVNRQTQHELIVSRLYYSVGQPDDFRIAADFTREEQQFFNYDPYRFGQETSHHAIAAESNLPDAIYSDSNGELVVVEADSGHYTTNQINQKQNEWKQFKQVWGQPLKPHAKVQSSANVQVFNY